MKDCPNCSASVDGLICPACGYRDPAYTAASNDRDVDPTRFLCCHVDRGQRCANPGTLTESTKGSDRWYCARHFPPFAGRGYSGKAERDEPAANPVKIPEGDFAALRAMLARSKGQGTDHREWARRILARHVDGEAVNAYALKSAREALEAAPYAGTSTFVTASDAFVAQDDPETIAEREAIRWEANQRAALEAGDLPG